MRQASAAALALLLALAPRAAGAQDAPPPDPAIGIPSIPPEPAETLPTKVADVPGTWDLSRDGTNRRCVMTLLRDRGPAGQRVNFPAGCRRALPVVNGVAGWLYADEAVRLVDANIRPVLLFKRRPDRRSYEAETGGETYSLVPLDIVGMRPPEPEPPKAEAPETGEAGVPTPPVPTPPATPAAVTQPPANQPSVTLPPAAGAPSPGTYALDRFRQQATCRLAFDGGGTVKLLPGCQDEGIEVFNPVRWRFADGRMIVTAKRGHSIELVPMGEGRWRRDPEVGTTFVLRRIEP